MTNITKITAFYDDGTSADFMSGADFAQAHAEQNNMLEAPVVETPVEAAPVPEAQVEAAPVEAPVEPVAVPEAPAADAVDTNGEAVPF